MTSEFGTKSHERSQNVVYEEGSTTNYELYAGVAGNSSMKKMTTIRSMKKSVSKFWCALSLSLFLPPSPSLYLSLSVSRPLSLSLSRSLALALSLSLLHTYSLSLSLCHTHTHISLISTHGGRTTNLSCKVNLPECG